MLSSPDPDPFTWLTIPEILTDLRLTETEWREWEAAGQTPTGVIFPDGQVRISHLAYARWLDSTPTNPDGDPLFFVADQIHDAIRYALRLAGNRGLTRDELADFFGRYVTPDEVEAGIEILIQEGTCISGPGTAPNCQTPHYRYWGP